MNLAVRVFEALVGQSRPLALALIFVVVALESSAFLGLIIPGETIVVLAGALAGWHILSFWTTAAVVASAAILGDIGGYLLGRYWGDALLAQWQFGRRQFERHRARVESYFTRWGSMTVLIGRFIAVGRAFTPFTAGLSKMPARSFVPMAVFSGIVWAGTFEVVGYLLGDNLPLLEHWLRRVGAGLFGLLALTALMVQLWRWLQKEQYLILRLLFTLRDKLASSRFGARVKPLAVTIGNFLRERFSPTGYLGIHLTVGLVLVGLLAWMFGSIVNDILAQTLLVRVDQKVTSFIQERRTPALDSLMATLSWVGDPHFLPPVVAATALYFAIQRRIADALLLIAVIAGAYAVALGLNEVFESVSPWAPQQTVVSGFADFPSIVLTAVTAGYGIVFYFIAIGAGSWRWATLSSVAAVYVVSIAALDQLYYGAPLSGVLAGIALGAGWLVICITGSIAWRRLAEAEETASLAPPRTARR